MLTFPVCYVLPRSPPPVVSREGEQELMEQVLHITVRSDRLLLMLPLMTRPCCRRLHAVGYHSGQVSVWSSSTVDVGIGRRVVAPLYDVYDRAARTCRLSRRAARSNKLCLAEDTERGVGELQRKRSSVIMILR